MVGTLEHYLIVVLISAAHDVVLVAMLLNLWTSNEKKYVQ